MKKIIIFVLSSFLFLIFIFNFSRKYLYRSKASNVSAKISFNESEISINPLGKIEVNIFIQTPVNTPVSGAQISVKYPSFLSFVETSESQVKEECYANNFKLNTIARVFDDKKNGILTISRVAKDPDINLPSGLFCWGTITFKADLSLSQTPITPPVSAVMSFYDNLNNNTYWEIVGPNNLFEPLIDDAKKMVKITVRPSGCNETCLINSDCQAGLICYQKNFCRNPLCPEKTNCSSCIVTSTPPISSPSQTPTKTPPTLTPVINPTKSYILPTISFKPSPIFTLTPTPTPTKIPSPTLTPTPICHKNKGDANCDAMIDLEDFNIWRIEYIAEISGSIELNKKRGDFNNDAKVSLLDFEIWRSNYSNVIRISIPATERISNTPTPTKTPTSTPIITTPKTSPTSIRIDF